MDIENLRRSLRGAVTTCDDAGYVAARGNLLFNRREPDRHPRLIVRAAGVADVQAVVRFAAAQDLRISVRGSGHNWSGVALRDGIVLDLSALNRVAIDAAARIAEVEPAATNREFAQALTARGLAFPVGHCGTVALSGYLLGGGLGWNSNEWGVAAFGVESLDVMTADGALRRASATENPEIFWAARGAGPEFFGVVTRYRLRLRPLPRAITTSLRTYPLERIGEVERWMTAAMRDAPGNLEFAAVMASAPPPLAGQAGKIVSGVATVFADSAEEACAALGRIAAAAPAGALDVQENMPMSFDVLYDIMAQSFPEGGRYAVDAFWGDGAGDAFFVQLARGVAAAPSPASFAIGVVRSPRAHVPPAVPDAAFSMMGRTFGAAYAIWRDPSEDAEQIGWLRATADALAPETIGHYVGEADLDRPGRIRGCFSPAAWDRLGALRSKYDPTGLFSPALPDADRGARSAAETPRARLAG